MEVTDYTLFPALSLQLFNKYVTFASVVIMQAHTSYMWDVESRKSQVKKKKRFLECSFDHRMYIAR